MRVMVANSVKGRTEVINNSKLKLSIYIAFLNI
jgi:hypothetical protein